MFCACVSRLCPVVRACPCVATQVTGTNLFFLRKKICLAVYPVVGGVSLPEREVFHIGSGAVDSGADYFLVVTKGAREPTQKDSVCVK